MAEEEKKETEVMSDFSSNKYVWIVGAVILLIVGWFGFKAILGSSQSYKVTLIDASKEVNVPGNATFTWRVDGSPTTINHTAVYMGLNSQSGELGKDVAPEATQYTLHVKDFESGNYNIPLQFVGNIIMENPGTYYYRVLAKVKDKNYWSDEYTFQVKVPDYSVTILDAPAEVDADKIFAFTWKVDGVPATINYTSIHLGTVSTPGTLGKDVKPEDTNYTDLVKDFVKGNYGIPLQFVGNQKISEAGTYYYRGHAIVNGQNYWTDEKTLVVKGKGTTKTLSPTVGAEKPEPTVAE